MIKALFTTAQVRLELGKITKKVETAIIAYYRRRGEQFVKECRDQNTWQDDTGNLRSSIGYFIYKGDELIKQRFGSAEMEGQDEALKTVESIDKKDDVFYLFGVAGMNYAAAVESKGYNVITEQTIKIIPLIEGDMKDLEKKIKAA